MDKVKVSSIIADLSSKSSLKDRNLESLKRDLITSVFRLFEDHSFVSLDKQKGYDSNFQDIWNATYSLVNLDKAIFSKETSDTVFFLQQNIEITRGNYSVSENIDYMVIQILIQLKKLILQDYGIGSKDWDEELLIGLVAYTVLLIYYLD